MGYIRYKVSDETEKIIDDVCKKLGIKKSELSRIAVMDYLKSLSIISGKVKENDKR
ncbi:MAG: hypothetical protein QW474_02855 [Candidatus Aenigmatarchaeota archaeon]